MPAVLSLLEPTTLGVAPRAKRAWAGFFLLFVVSTVCALAQEPSSPPAATASKMAPVTQVSESPPTWKELTSNQEQALRPLEPTWASLATGHKRKWIAISQNFQNLAPKEQEKLHGRMREWAALKPSDRTLARLNFAETKKIAQSDRTTHWEAYQALSTDERANLAAKAAKPKPRAALAIKPVPAEKLAPVPVTRKTPLMAEELAALKQSINRNTLLPVAPPNTPVAKQP